MTRQSVVTIDVMNCIGSLLEVHDQYNLKYEVTLNRVRQALVSTRLLDAGKGISDKEVTYNYPLDQQYRDYGFPPIVTWLIRGLHGIPMECRKQQGER
jgi:hypothetical protein